MPWAPNLLGFQPAQGRPFVPKRKNSINSPCRNRAARQFVNSFNSLLRRLRPTNELRRSPQPRCKNSINSNLRRERPERAASSQPRATPWVPEYKALRPVRAKVWAHLLFITFALTGRRCGTYVNPGRCPGLRTCWAFSPRRAARLSRSAKIRLIRPAATERPGNSLIRLIRCYAV